MRGAAVYFVQAEEAVREKKLHHMAGEALLSYALKKEYGRELRFEPRDRMEHGKPFFTLEPMIHYNISHSGKYILCAFAEEEIGVDVQEHRPADYRRILLRMMGEQEADRLLAGEEPVKEFYRQWVMREAYLKWTGEGFSKALRDIPMDRGNCEMISLPDSGYSAALWSMNPLKIRIIEVPFLDIPLDSL